MLIVNVVNKTDKKSLPIKETENFNNLKEKDWVVSWVENLISPLALKKRNIFNWLEINAKAKLKLEFEIEKFHCIELGIVIDDEDMFKALLERATQSECICSLVPLGENENYDEQRGNLKTSTEERTKRPTSSFSLMRNDIRAMKDELSKPSATREEPISRSLRREKTCSEVMKNIKDLKDEQEKLSISDNEKKKQLEKEFKKLLLKSVDTAEANTTEINQLELKIKQLELRNAKISKIFNDLKKAEEVDLCFMVDCTGSMVSYIEEAKNVVQKIVNRLRKRFQDFQLRCAFVGYRDHDDGNNRVCVLPFTSDKDVFNDWVKKIYSFGGDDECEDIFGALEEVNNLEWKRMSRVLFHIGDAPCHGRRFYVEANDAYPDGDPRCLNIDTLLKGIATKNIDYYFAEINETTVKMIDEFNKVLYDHNYGREIKKMKLASAKDLLDTVTATITSSIFNSKSLSLHDAHGKPMKTYKVDNSPIIWSFDESKFEKHTADLYETSFSSGLLDIKENHVTYNKRKVDIWLAKRPFAKGGLRYAFAAFINMGTASSPKYVKSVMKESIFVGPEFNTENYYKGLIEVQVVSKFLAEEFMKEMKGVNKMRFLDVNMIQVDKTGIYYSIEEFIDSEFTKWTNNAGMVNEDEYSATLNAFSHWTYQATNQYLIVTDLQGFKFGETYLLTDPAITCAESYDRFSSTNLAKKGVKKFFITHRCNIVCERLKLKKHKFQLLSSRRIDTEKIS